MFPTKISFTIFIDDLDRATPKNIASIMEAINRIIAIENLKCNFVLGMDSQVVAAALESEYERVLSKLPKYTKNNTMGLKFMDKFVQLPISLPSPEPTDVKNYIKSTWLGQAITEDKPSRDEIIAQIDEWTSIYSEELEEVAERILDDSKPQLSSNPREIKRQLNMMRYQYFMTLVRNLLSLPSPSLDQIHAWVMLMATWPDVATRIKKSGNESPKIIQSIDKMATSSKKFETWMRKLEKKYPDEVKEIPGFSDKKLYDFFVQFKESNLYKYAETGFY